MRKSLGTLSKIVISTAISLGLAGCANLNYGAKSTLYLMGPHGEPAPVLNSRTAPQPRSMRFRVYNTENGEMLVIEDYEGSRVGESRPSCYRVGYAKYPSGKTGLTLLPVEVGVYGTKSPQGGKKDEKPEESPGAEPGTLEGKAMETLNRANAVLDGTGRVLDNLGDVLEETQERLGTSVEELSRPYPAPAESNNNPSPLPTPN